MDNGWNGACIIGKLPLAAASADKKLRFLVIAALALSVASRLFRDYTRDEMVKHGCRAFLGLLLLGLCSCWQTGEADEGPKYREPAEPIPQASCG